MPIVMDNHRRIDEIDEGIHRVFTNLAASLGITLRVDSGSTDDILSWVVTETPPPFGRVGVSTTVSLSLLAVKAGKVVALYLEQVKGRPEGPEPKADLLLAIVLHHTTGCPVTYWTSLGITEADELVRGSRREITIGYNETHTLANGIHIGYPTVSAWRRLFRK